MQWINPDDVKKAVQNKNGWLDKAKEVTDSLEKANSKDDRKKIVSDKSGIWSEIKDTLGSVSNEKCWYCESKEIRSDKPVDHFRPKGRVAESSTHEGYWWLAFTWENYRYCCTYCNSRRIDQPGGTAGGKQDHFPLKDETKRATATNRNSVEIPLLLDPCREEDPDLIVPRPDGSVEPRYKKQDDAWRHRRADESIRLYHLKHRLLAEARGATWQNVVEEADTAERLWEKYLARDPDAVVIFQRTLKSLERRIEPKAEHSQVARMALKFYRDLEWAEQLLNEYP